MKVRETMSLETIELAVGGEYESISEVVEYYSAYIKTICSTHYQEGNAVQYCFIKKCMNRLKRSWLKKYSNLN